MKKKDLKNDISVYMAAIGKMGGKALAAKKKKEDPNYFSRLRKNAWKKKRERERKEKEEAGDKSE